MSASATSADGFEATVDWEYDVIGMETCVPAAKTETLEFVAAKQTVPKRRSQTPCWDCRLGPTCRSHEGCSPAARLLMSVRHQRRGEAQAISTTTVPWTRSLVETEARAASLLALLRAAPRYADAVLQALPRVAAAVDVAATLAAASAENAEACVTTWLVVNGMALALLFFVVVAVIVAVGTSISVVRKMAEVVAAAAAALPNIFQPSRVHCLVQLLAPNPVGGNPSVTNTVWGGKRSEPASEIHKFALEYRREKLMAPPVKPLRWPHGPSHVAPGRRIAA